MVLHISPGVLLIVYLALIGGLLFLSILSLFKCLASRRTEGKNEKKAWTMPLFCAGVLFITLIAFMPWYMKEYVLPMTNLDWSDQELLQLHKSGHAEPLQVHCMKHNRITWLAKSAVMKATPAWLMKTSHRFLERLNIVPMSMSLFGMRGGICVRSLLEMPHVQNQTSDLLACHLRTNVEIVNLRDDLSSSKSAKNPGRNLDGKFCNKMFNVVVDELINGEDYKRILGVIYIMFYGQNFWGAVGALLDRNVLKLIETRLRMNNKGHAHLAVQMWKAITFNQNSNNKGQDDESTSKKTQGRHSFFQKVNPIRFLSRSHRSGSETQRLGVDVAADGIIEEVQLERKD